ncbi:aspartate dehydrogenase [Natrarchaeobius oligotrophus]|uniref:L-aspartate dehydrogenase n=1 Tax=Natrarchaeobius chitinivorans TaxID=1679083 RepID=A0A3N6N411_NATCH|nr:aspartate dehydrogenase [Natrarchaeobius chitinivorans]RQH02447.1 aspartate dehydrogenase [Natrarchaeobius chitinivorans]
MSRSIGIFGGGTIATEIARAISDGTLSAELAAVYDRHPENVNRIQALFDQESAPDEADDPSALLEADLVLEAAGQTAVEQIAVDALSGGRDCMILSVGALADAALRKGVFEAARASEGRLYAPSGAIAGLDAVKTAALTGDLESVALTTTKPPAGLEGAPYVVDNEIDLADIDEPTVIFDGPATEAAAAFPSNINVAVALSLAGIGPDETAVRIVADPEEENNVHEITAEGGMGRIETTVRNVPSPTNPKTSYLAAISAIETLRGLETSIDIGT